jgi:hypothetical protein
MQLPAVQPQTVLAKARSWILMVFVALVTSPVAAHGAYGVDFPHAIGGGYELAYSAARSENAAIHSAFLSYRSGFFSSISAFWGADIGYRFAENTVRARVGVEGLLVFLGPQLGVIIDRTANEARLGGYIGFGGGLPDRHPNQAVTAFIGGNFVSGVAPEFYFKLTYFIVP